MRYAPVGGNQYTGMETSGFANAVVDNVATRLGVSKGDVLAVKDGLSAGNAAVRLALGETAIIEENLLFFAKQGIDLDTRVVEAAGSNNGNKDEPRRSKTRILVKNLPHDTTKEELTKIFGSAATANATQQPLDIHLAPSRTIAVVDYPNRKSATGAFRRLAYNERGEAENPIPKILRFRSAGLV